MCMMNCVGDKIKYILVSLLIKPIVRIMSRRQPSTIKRTKDHHYIGINYCFVNLIKL